ncbi:MAG: lysophospholipid acyltransferase family protein [Candidatus Thermoplasmatota archaeon]|nr:lysophospholipid acyltransferase family protein [Candidatus Thermoplasmatota archaeon]
MQRTIFDTPVIYPALRRLSRILLGSTGWKAVGGPSGHEKYLLILAPHTSNWDFVIIFTIAFATDIKGHWFGKHSLFKPPLGWFFRWLGGIPIERSKTMNRVDQTIKAFREMDELMITITPEGTRKRTERWKSGFYHIALGAGVPLGFGYLDFKKKEGGIGRFYTLTGDQEKDMEVIARFYEGIEGKHPEKFGSIRL